MTAPRVQSPDTLLHRLLSPEEFEQAQTLPPETLRSGVFPLLPPIAAPRESTRVGLGPANPNAQQLEGGQKFASDVFGAAASVYEHPVETLFTTIGGPVIALFHAAERTNELQIQNDRARRGLPAHYPSSGMTPDERKAGATQDLTDLAMIGGAALAGPAESTIAKGAAKLVGERAASAVSKAAVGAGLGAAMNPDNPAVGATLGAGLGLAAQRATSDAATPAAESHPVVQQAAKDVLDAWNVIFDPGSRSKEAGEAALIMRAATGEGAARYEQAAHQLDGFRRASEALPVEERLAFIDNIEGGKSQVTPAFQQAADQIRKTLDDTRDAIQNLGTGKLEHFIEDYFPHIWEDPKAAADVMKTFGARRPFEGSKSFLKQRTIPTTAEGIAMGLTPVSTNPVDLTLLKHREMLKYLTAHTALNDMKEAGFVKYVAEGGEIPDGYRRIDDKIATVFGPRTGAVTLPEGAVQAVSYEGGRGGITGAVPLTPEDVGVMGRRIMGEYWAPESVARVVNNHLSPGLRGNALFDAYRGLGNTLNQAQLGLSAFHLGMTSMDASVSRVALGLEHIINSDATNWRAKWEGAKKIASSPAAPVTNALLGHKVRQAYLNPENASPDMRALVNAVTEAGGRVRMDSFYKNSYPERVVKAWKEGEYGTAAGFSLPAAFELASKPLMEFVVPRQKLGVFADMVRKIDADMPPTAGVNERRRAYAKAWDSVDNRMGQLVYDNLFWDKTTKDALMASVRSVGWNLGTIRELGGGVGDLWGAAAQTAKGKRLELSHRAAYMVALPMTVALWGAAYQYLRTGEGPAELKDYFYPRTGEQDLDGNPERVQFPTYMKDLVAYSHAPWTTAKHKLHPAITTVTEMLNNEDFYGDQIRNENDPVVQQMLQEVNYALHAVTPFTIRNLAESGKRGDQSQATKIGNWFGVTPAPRKAVRSDAQNRMADILSTRQMSGATPEDAEARQARAEILSGLRGAKGIDVEQAVTQALEHQQLTPPELGRLLKRAGMTPAQEKFKRLTLPEAIDVFRLATPREKALFAEALAKKIERVGQ